MSAPPPNSGHLQCSSPWALRAMRELATASKVRRNVTTCEKFVL
jgi:hypothetical protein